MSESANGERRLKIIVATFSVVIIVAMLSVRACMKAREAQEVEHDDAPAASVANPGAGKWCAVSTTPGGATAYALKGEGRVALGVTPLDVEQGDYEVRLELSGHAPVTAKVGVVDGPCKLHRELPPE